jgi:hypothetical protein
VDYICIPTTDEGDLTDTGANIFELPQALDFYSVAVWAPNVEDIGVYGVITYSAVPRIDLLCMMHGRGCVLSDLDPNKVNGVARHQTPPPTSSKSLTSPKSDRRNHRSKV